jgi:hypothetical protein
LWIPKPPVKSISGTISNAAGAWANASVTVKLDKTPPTLTLTSPSSGSTQTTLTLNVNGTTADPNGPTGLASGLSTVYCNEVAATLNSGTYTCTVSLNQGSNVLIITASDDADNRTSVTATYTLAPSPAPSSLTITPSKLAVVVVSEDRKIQENTDRFQVRTGSVFHGGGEPLGEIKPNCSSSACAPTQIYYETHLRKAQTSTWDAGRHLTKTRLQYVHATGVSIGRTIAPEFGLRRFSSGAGMHTGPATEYNSGELKYDAELALWFFHPRLYWGKWTFRELDCVFSRTPPCPL